MITPDKIYPTFVGYRTVRMPNHPLAPSSGTLGLHRVVLYDAIGPGDHNCHWCRRTVAWKRLSYAEPHPFDGVLVVDHLDGDPSNNVASNLVPSCQGCNALRGRWPARLTAKGSAA